MRNNYRELLLLFPLHFKLLLIIVIKFVAFLLYSFCTFILHCNLYRYNFHHNCIIFLYKHTNYKYFKRRSNIVIIKISTKILNFEFDTIKKKYTSHNFSRYMFKINQQNHNLFLFLILIFVVINFTSKFYFSPIIIYHNDFLFFFKLRNTISTHVKLLLQYNFYYSLTFLVRYNSNDYKVPFISYYFFPYYFLLFPLLTSRLFFFFHL